MPEDRRRVRELAREHTTLAINTLAEICGDAGAKSQARVQAACALLDRGWGRPDAHDVLIDATDDALRAEISRRARMERDEALRAEIQRRIELERARPSGVADPDDGETH